MHIELIIGLWWSRRKIWCIQQQKFFIVSSAKLSIPSQSLFMNGRAEWPHIMLQW